MIDYRGTPAAKITCLLLGSKQSFVVRLSITLTLQGRRFFEKNSESAFLSPKMVESKN
jgi:hypothetical protein